MKKFLGLILLSFFWCNIVIAECQKGDCVNGEGTYAYASGDKYAGEFKDGNRHGQGTYTWANGGKYVGEYKMV